MDGPTSKPDEQARAADERGASDERAGAMDRRTRAVARLCYDGESLVDVVPFSGGVVGVTSHRVLALTPGDDGPNLQSVDRPNVTEIEVAAGGEAAHGVRALRYGVYALALIGGSYLVDFGSVGGVQPPAGTGVGQVVNLALAMTGLLALVDDVVRVAGLGVLVVALLLVAVYARSRESYLAIGVAGDDPVRVPASTAESASVARLRVAVEKASNPSAS